MISKLKSYFQAKWMGFLTHNLYKAVTKDEILGIEWSKDLQPIVRYKGIKLDTEKIARLKADAVAFENSFLYKFLDNNIRYVSQDKMYYSSTVEYDLLFGKAMLYNLKVIEDAISDIKKLP